MASAERAGWLVSALAKVRVAEFKRLYSLRWLDAARRGVVNVYAERQDLLLVALQVF
jgi:hypothetical protein